MLDARNHEIKRWCPDFRPIRRLLRSLHAEREPPRRQVDVYYRLPDGGPEIESRHLKLRTERGRRWLIAYEASYADGLRDVRYRVVEASADLGRALEAALGVSAVVRKRREVWREGRTRFNLDAVDGLGTIFEGEVVLAPGEEPGAASAYLALFEPYLGEPIVASNEELMRGGPDR